MSLGAHIKNFRLKMRNSDLYILAIDSSPLYLKPLGTIVICDLLETQRVLIRFGIKGKNSQDLKYCVCVLKKMGVFSFGPIKKKVMYSKIVGGF